MGSFSSLEIVQYYENLVGHLRQTVWIHNNDYTARRRYQISIVVFLISKLWNDRVHSTTARDQPIFLENTSDWSEIK